jgi:hypothetical protein
MSQGKYLKVSNVIDKELPATGFEPGKFGPLDPHTHSTNNGVAKRLKTTLKNLNTP